MISNKTLRIVRIIWIWPERSEKLAKIHGVFHLHRDQRSIFSNSKGSSFRALSELIEDDFFFFVLIIMFLFVSISIDNNSQYPYPLIQLNVNKLFFVKQCKCNRMSLHFTLANHKTFTSSHMTSMKY